MKIKTGSLVKLPKKVASSIRITESRISAIDQDRFFGKALYYPSVHLLSRKSKLLRPTLIFLSAYALGEDPAKFIDLAIAAELLHTSSLIHDDIIDGDRVRRSVDAVHVRYGKEAAILAGDALISEAIRLSCNYNTDVIRTITRSSMAMCGGEIMDYDYQKSKKIPNLNAYLNIAELKSASLIGTCCNIVAVYKNSENAKSLYEFGIDLGIAFQIRDDILDFASAKHNGAKSDAAHFRPNIVRTLKQRKGISNEDALSHAVEMNGFYIDKGLSRIKDKKMREIFGKYADSIRISFQ